MSFLTRNAVDPDSQSPNTKPTLSLLTSNEVDYVALANEIFSICLFHVPFLYPIKASCFSTIFCYSPKGDCLLHEVSKYVRITCTVFSNHVLTTYKVLSIATEG